MGCQRSKQDGLGRKGKQSAFLVNVHVFADCAFESAPLSAACCVRRRRPFLIKSLENTLNKLILSLEFYEENDRKKIAISEYDVELQ